MAAVSVKPGTGLLRLDPAMERNLVFPVERETVGGSGARRIPSPEKPDRQPGRSPCPVSVSPSCNFFKHRVRAGRLVVAPESPSSLKTILHLARLSAALVVCRDSGIAVFHAPIMGQQNGTAQALFLPALISVPKPTLFETGRAHEFREDGLSSLGFFAVQTLLDCPFHVVNHVF